MQARIGLPLLLIHAMATPAFGQQPIELKPGDRVRVFAPAVSDQESKPVEGRLRRVGPTAIVITTRAGVDTEIPLAAVTELRRIRGKPVKGAVLGAMLAFFVGTAAVAPFDHTQDQPKALAAGVAAALVGALIGSTIRWTQWEHGDEGGRRITVLPRLTPRGGGVAVTIGF